MARGRWTDDEDQNLRAWIADGLTVARISVRLRRTIHGVMSRCKALGLSSGRKTLGQSLAIMHADRLQVTGTGKKQLIDVPDAEPVMPKDPPSA